MCFLRKETSYNLVSNKKISANELLTLLKNKYPDADVFISDNEYTLCHYDDIAYFLAQNQVNKIIYQSEDMDCDDFSAALWGDFSKPPFSKLTIGLIWTNVHALNIAINEDKEVLFIEPQTDEILDNLQNWMGNEIRVIII